MTSFTSSCRPGDSGHTRLDAEDVATRAAGFILRTGAAGAEQRVSGRRRLLISRQISRQICHLKHFTTERGTTSRKITPTTTNTGDTRGGKQRGNGHHHQRRTRTSTNTGLPLTRRALARPLMATLEGGTASAILPKTGVLFNSSGRPPGKFKLWSFRDWVRSLPAAAIRRRIRYPCGFGDSPAAAAAPTPARRHASCHVYLGNSLFSGSLRSSSERRSPSALHRT